MKKAYPVLILVLLVILTVCFISFRSQVHRDVTDHLLPEHGEHLVNERSGSTGVLLKDCLESNLRMKYLCDFAWRDSAEDQYGVYYEINTNPRVVFRIVKFDLDILYIQQLSKERLASLGRYQDGFRTEEVSIAGTKAIKVKAFAIDDNQTRLSDYYFVRDKILYAVLFSVNPKEKWDEYQFIFQEIAQSLRFF